MKTLMISGEVIRRNTGKVVVLSRMIDISDHDFPSVVDRLRKSKSAWTDLAKEHIPYGDCVGYGTWGNIGIQIRKDGQWHDVTFDDTDDPSLGTGRVQAK